MGVRDKIAFLILYYISSRLVPLLEVVDAPIQVPTIFYLTMMGMLGVSSLKMKVLAVKMETVTMIGKGR